MHLHPPCLVLVPDTFISVCDVPLGSSGKRPFATSLLVQVIQEEFPGVCLEPVARRYWNDSGGMYESLCSTTRVPKRTHYLGLEFILQLCVEDDERAGTVIAVSNKCIYSVSHTHILFIRWNSRYYALSAACALFKHAEAKMNTRFAAESLRIRYVPVEGTMMIDPDTARNLELVENMTYKKSLHSLFGCAWDLLFKLCLLTSRSRILNHSYTAMASRLLRVNILSPITGTLLKTFFNVSLEVISRAVQTSIDARLDVVEGSR